MFFSRVYIYIQFFLIFLISLINGRTSDELRVTLSDGSKIVGRHLTSHSGHGIRAFMGIPYAEPPIGDLRFKAPVPVKPWSDEKQTVADSDICIQRDPFRRDSEIVGSEDCLYLNVYTPQFVHSTRPLAVMVFFHGGGWQCGSGISDFYGPDFIMDNEIIYIGANFRLGPLGFLSTEQKDCPGNFGLKDQVAVLRWIRNNIQVFGGNPNQVTVFGESAGGASVTYFMQSPLARGLFHRAISQSGTNLNPWAQPAHVGVAAKRAEYVGHRLGCPKTNENWHEMINCLRNISAADITKIFYDFFEWDTDPMIPFPPVVEIDSPEAFITKHPRDVEDVHGNNIPWMTGITFDEGAMKSAPIIALADLYSDIKTNWNHALPIALNYDHHSENVQKKLTEKINEFYFNNKGLTTETHQNLTNLFTDGWFLTGMDHTLRKRFQNVNAAETFVYLFAHAGQASFTEIFKGGRENFYGVCHAEELQYLFPIGKHLFISAAPTKIDRKISKTLVNMWINFAKNGHPTLNDNNLPEWKPTKMYPLEYLRIGTRNQKDLPLIAMEVGLFEERAEFWRKLKAHVPTRDVYKEEL